MSKTAARTGTAPRITVEAPATHDSLALLSGVLQLYLREGIGLPDEAPHAVRIRREIVETMTKVIRHGGAESEPGPVELSLERVGDRLKCVLRDRAARFHPFERPSAADIRSPGAEAPGVVVGARGIAGTVMDQVRHRYDPAAGNELTLTVRLRV